MKNFLKKITGLDKEEQRIADEKARVAEDEMELLKKKDPKEYATRRQEPWVSVLDVKVNRENVRNGFFELDWNRHFVLQLIEAGYGVENDKEEEIIDRWFRELCANVVVDGDFGGPLEGMATGNVDIETIKRDNK